MIGLCTDSLIANIPLMKIASYYGADNVDWYYPLNHLNYEKIYYSKIFNFTYKLDRQGEMITGGTGHDLKKKLPGDIEKCQPEYKIYRDCDYSLQYFSRGCIRKCPFCVVYEKEGFIYPVEPMNLNPNGKFIRVFDNNFFANPQWREAIEYLRKMNQPVEFNSGIDVRIFDEEQGAALKKIKKSGYLHIAWDNPRQDLRSKIKEMIKYVSKHRILCYVLIGYDSTQEEDLYRCESLRDLGVMPFVMPYNKKDEYQRRFARWANHKAIFKSVKWKDYRKNACKKHNIVV